MAVIDRDQIQLVLSHLIGGMARRMGSSIQRDITVVTARAAAMIEITVACAEARPATDPFPPYGPSEFDRAWSDLPFCSAIVRAHGGDLHVEDFDDGGEICRFTVPAASAANLG